MTERLFWRLLLVTAILVITASVLLAQAIMSLTVKAGETVTDPGSREVFGIAGIYKKFPVVVPINWQEIPASDRVRAYSMFTGTKYESPSCARQTGAKMTVLEQLEDEVLVRYSNSKTRGPYDDTCPSNVMFWISVKDFRNAGSEYEKVKKQEAEQEEEGRRRLEKERKKAEIGRRYLKPANSAFLTQEPSVADRPRRGPTAPVPSFL